MHFIKANNDDDVLSEFADFLRVDRRLNENTIRRHLLEIRRLLKYARFNVVNATRNDIRDYLKNFIGIPAGSYANILKTLRLFYREYLNRPEVIEGFKFPAKSINVNVNIPNKEQLKEFYESLDKPVARALFLLYATSGLRKREVLNLRIGDIDFEKRMIIPNNNGNRTKRTWITFYNDEAAKAFKEYLGDWTKLDKNMKIFSKGVKYFVMKYRLWNKEKGIKISPQILREWFCNEMGKLGVADRYVDAFCGRVPRSILAAYYTDYSPEKLKEIYDKADLRILD
ncbi:MAG: integrase [Nitrososphaerota archaeon]